MSEGSSGGSAETEAAGPVPEHPQVHGHERIWHLLRAINSC